MAQSQSENEPLWFLCNSQTRFESGAVNFNSAKQTCSEILEADAPNWHVWQEGWTAWKPLTDVTELHALIKRKPLPPPIPVAPPPIPLGPPPMPKASTEPPVLAKPIVTPTLSLPAKPNFVVPTRPPILQPIPAAIDVPVLNSKNSSERLDDTKTGLDRRKFERCEVRLRVIIRNDQLTFRTFSRDISLGGISLEHPLPPHIFGKKCQIFVAGPNQRENLRMTLATTSRNDLRYFSFADLELQFQNKLKLWLDSFKQKSSSRSA